MADDIKEYQEKWRNHVLRAAGGSLSNRHQALQQRAAVVQFRCGQNGSAPSTEDEWLPVSCQRPSSEGNSRQRIAFCPTESVLFSDNNCKVLYFSQFMNLSVMNTELNFIRFYRNCTRESIQYSPFFQNLEVARSVTNVPVLQSKHSLQYSQQHTTRLLRALPISTVRAMCLTALILHGLMSLTEDYNVQISCYLLLYCF